MNEHLINLVLALAAGELIHNVLEAQQVRKKVSWLKQTLAGKKYEDKLPFSIDTRTKSYVISFLGFIVTTAILYGLFSIVNFSGNSAIWIVVALLVLAYVATAVILDKYHVEIHALIRASKK